MAQSVVVTFIAKPGCHLCDDARPVVETVCNEFITAGLPVVLEELDMLADERLIAEYQEDIPVVLVNGRRHAFWKVDADRLRAAVKKAGRRSLFRRGNPTGV